MNNAFIFFTFYIIIIYTFKLMKKSFKEINKQVILSKLFLSMEAFNIKSIIFPEVEFKFMSLP